MELTDIIMQAMEKYPADTDAAIDHALELIEQEPSQVQIAMHQELVPDGVRYRLQLARAFTKVEVKGTNRPDSISVPTPRPSRSRAAQAAVRSTIFETWPIGRGSERKMLGDATKADLDREIGFGENQQTGIEMNNTFYRRLGEKLNGRKTVRKAWKADDVEAIKREIWEKVDAAA